MSHQLIEVKVQESPKDWAAKMKVGVEIVAPLFTAIVAVFLLRLTKRMDHSQWQSQKLIEKRIDVWDDAGPIINDIFCYCMRVGAWKTFSPPVVIDKKREADKMVHLSRPYFSAAFFRRYEDLIRICFETYQGHGADAKLKTPVWEHKNAHQAWEQAWDGLFHEQPTAEEMLRSRYEALLNQVRLDLTSVERNEPRWWRGWFRRRWTKA